MLNKERPGGWTDTDVADLADGEIKGSGSCLVVVNTRKSAVSLYQAYSVPEDAKKYHLSTSMCPEHRRDVLAQIRVAP